MITENGIVTRATTDTAWVTTTKSAACEGCTSKDSCGAGHHGSKEMTVSVKNTLGVALGDLVVIGMETRPMMVLSFLLYVFPIILLVIGALIGDSLAPVLGINESLAAMTLAFTFFAAAFLLLRKRQTHLSEKNGYQPFLVRKRPSPSPERCSHL
jgi:sigma-E factor negative regulatory protein RseC